MKHDTHLILFLYKGYVGSGVSFMDQNLMAFAKEKLPEGTPFFIVEKSLRETLPDQNWQNVQLDWSNPDGYGERVMPTPEE